MSVSMLRPLGDVADFLSGFAWKAKQFSNDPIGMPIIRIQNVGADASTDFKYWPESYADRFVISRGDLLLTLSGSFRTVVWTGPNALLNQRIVKVSAHADTDTRWLFYALEEAMARIASMGRHALVSNVALSDLKELQINVPPLEEQKRIAGILDQADALRRLRSRALDKLNTLGQAIFHEMFGDPAINPNGWPMGVVGDLLEEAKYGTSGKANTEGKGLPILRMGNVTYDGQIDLSDLKHIELGDHEFEKYSTKPGDILFNRTNSKDLVGKTAVVTHTEPLAIAGYLVRGRVNEAGNPHYISGYLNSPHGKAVLRNKCKNIVGMANINAKEFQAIPIALPPVEAQREFAEKLSNLRGKTPAFNKSQREMDSLFASLQHRAFRGEL